MNAGAGYEPAQALGGPAGLEPASPIVMPRLRSTTWPGWRGWRLRRFLEPRPSLVG
jgi:hypothetical protein